MENLVHICRSGYIFAFCRGGGKVKFISDSEYYIWIKVKTFIQIICQLLSYLISKLIRKLTCSLYL